MGHIYFPAAYSINVGVEAGRSSYQVKLYAKATRQPYRQAVVAWQIDISS
jgi:hypothetical protein